jgi:hypothetical protein
MWRKLLPPAADNRYQGHWAALWLLGFLVVGKSIMSLNVIFNGRFVATVPDGIPLDSFSPEAARTVLAMFAIWGVAHLVLNLFGALVMFRYRAFVPLAFLLLLAEHVLRRTALFFIPLARVGSPSGPLVNLILLALMVIGFGLSLWSTKRA